MLMWHSFITFQKQLKLMWHFLNVHALKLFPMSLFSSGQAFQLVLFPFFCLAWLRQRETWLHGCLASAMAGDCGGKAPLWSNKHSQHACLLMLLHGVDDALSSLTFTTREEQAKCVVSPRRFVVLDWDTRGWAGHSCSGEIKMFFGSL